MRRAAALPATILAILALGAGSAGAASAPPGFFGVNGQDSSAADFAAMRAADVGIYRTAFAYGSFKQAPRAPFDWSYSDEIVANAALNGIDLIPMMYGTPPWISRDLNSTPLEGEAARGWRELLIEVVSRYGPGGRFWSERPEIPYRPLEAYQIWNEPNSMTWWGPRPAPREYAALLRRSARAIHLVDPGARILTAGIVSDPTNAHAIRGPRYLRKLLADGRTARAADAVGFHPYAPTAPEVRDRLREARSALGETPAAGTPIWITEIGWGSVGRRSHPLIKTVAGQKRTLARTFRMIAANRIRLGVERTLWYLWRERPDALCRWCESSGLLQESGRAKSLLDTFRRAAAR